MRQRRFFYLTGSFSFIAYIALLFLIFGLINLKGPDKFVFKTDTQFEQIIPIEALLIEEPKPTPPQPQKPVVSEPQEIKQNLPGLRDLFSDIPDFSKEDEQKAKQKQREKEALLKKLEEEKQRQQEFTKRQQESIKNLQNSLQSLNKTLENINASIDIKTEIPPNQDKGLHDAWMDKIYKILYTNWNFSFYHKATISVLIHIASDGSFSYKILRYSQFDDYNEKIKAVLNHLKESKMPPYPDGKSINLEVNFKSKVQDE